MLSTRLLVAGFVGVLAFGSTGVAHAGRLVYMGPDPSCHTTSEQTQQATNIVRWAGHGNDPRVLLVNANCSGDTMLMNAGFTQVTSIDESQFSIQTLSNFDVIYVTYTSHAGNFLSSAAAVASFVGAGGGLAIEGNANSIAWAPFGNVVGYKKQQSDSVTIVDPIHPVMAGLTSGGFDNSHATFSNAPGAGFQILARDGNGRVDFIVKDVASSAVPAMSWPAMAGLSILLLTLGLQHLRRSTSLD